MKKKQKVVQLLKSWEYKNYLAGLDGLVSVVQLLKSWEYKNYLPNHIQLLEVVQLLKSWEYKNKYGVACGVGYGCTVT